MVVHEHSGNGCKQGRSAGRLIGEAGDAFAFENLVRQYEPRIFRNVFRITRHREDAEDAMQEAVVCAFKHFDKFEQRSQFGTWFTRIAVNQALMCLRRRKRSILTTPMSEESYQVMLETIPDSTPNAEEQISNGEFRNLLHHAVCRLEPSLSVVVTLQIVDGLSLEEMAEKLRLSVPAVKSRLTRARRKLSLMLRDQSPEATSNCTGE